MGRVTDEIYRREGEKLTRYTIEDESYEDEYGSIHVSYVPYRYDGNKRHRLSPETMNLGWLDARSYITLRERKTCEHCGSTCLEQEQVPDGTPSESSGQPA